MDLSESMDQSVEKSTGMEDSSNDNERQSLLRRSKQILGEDVQLGEARSNRGRRGKHDLCH
jgi:hypothetical protein